MLDTVQVLSWQPGRLCERKSLLTLEQYSDLKIWSEILNKINELQIKYNGYNN